TLFSGQLSNNRIEFWSQDNDSNPTPNWTHRLHINKRLYITRIKCSTNWYIVNPGSIGKWCNHTRIVT
ncbi:hypothetical protein RDWZM_001904, partial [Blomia tropicalis]